MLLGFNDSRPPEDSDVVVVGVGPVGATAALALALEGLRVTVFEAGLAGDGVLGESRASTFHPPTLEILDGLDVSAPLHEVGLVSDTYQYRDRAEGLVAHFDLAEIAGDTPFPYRLQSEQQNLVRIIGDRLAELPNVRLFENAHVRSAATDGEEAVVRVAGSADPEAPEVEYRARWAIAADGAHSPIRHALGIGFPGITYPEQFLVVSTSADFAELIPGIASVNYISDPREWLVLLRTPLHWRALFPIPPGEQVATLRDVSQSGLKLAHDGRFTAGLPVKVRLSPELERRGVVRWSQTGLAGVVLTEGLSVEELGSMRDL